MHGRLGVQQHHVRAAAPREALLVLVVGDDGADGQVALLQAAEHEARDGQVDGRGDVRRLVELVRAAVQQQQRECGKVGKARSAPSHDVDVKT